MEPKAVTKELYSLAQLDIDAIHAYDAALKNVDTSHIRDELTRFRADHERHVKDLSEVIRRMGEQPPSHSPDFKGFLIKGFTAVRSATGTEGALKAMKSNEELVNRTYSRVAAMDFPVDVRALVQRNFSDEQRHLRSIEQWITSRAWEQTGATP